MGLISFRKIFIGVIFGALTSVTLLLVFALILSRLEDPKSLTAVFSLIAMSVGALVCGKVSTLGIERKALQGIFAGLVFIAVILLPSLILSEFEMLSLLKMLLCLVFAFTGAMVGRKGTGMVASSKRRRSVMKRYAR